MWPKLFSVVTATIIMFLKQQATAYNWGNNDILYEMIYKKLC